MFDANSYLNNTSTSDSSSYYAPSIKEIVKYVVDNKETIRKELESLARLQAERPNNIFPIKIKNLAEGFNCFEICNEWYNVKIKE